MGEGHPYQLLTNTWLDQGPPSIDGSPPSGRAQRGRHLSMSQAQGVEGEQADAETQSNTRIDPAGGVVQDDTPSALRQRRPSCARVLHASRAWLMNFCDRRLEDPSRVVWCTSISPRGNRSLFVFLSSSSGGYGHIDWVVILVPI